jgi:hypothetical protein
MSGIKVFWQVSGRSLKIFGRDEAPKRWLEKVIKRRTVLM